VKIERAPHQEIISREGRAQVYRWERLGEALAKSAMTSWVSCDTQEEARRRETGGQVRATETELTKANAKASGEEARRVLAERGGVPW